MHHLYRRRAITISIIFHIFFVIGAGYLSAQSVAAPVVEEKYVELELMNNTQRENVNNTLPDNEPPSPASPSTSSPLTTINQQQSSTQNISESINMTPVVTTEALTLTATTNVASSSSAEPSSTKESGTIQGSRTTINTPPTSAGVIAPSILNKIAPLYPQSARLAGIEGTVILKIQIYENGLPGMIGISRSSGNQELDDAAIATVKQWRFIPAKDRDSGRPIICYTTMPISFHLK